MNGQRPPADAGRRLMVLARRMTGEPVLALVPLRVFLGGTFLYAGLDKLFDPSFLEAGAPGSIGAQLAAFARTSPLAPLIHLIQPWALEVGLLVAIAEIGIGLGALSGFGFRLAAAGGAGLALLFWLTASWATRPYYYGPDLPYAAGWLTLALAGHGGFLILRRRPPVTVASIDPGAAHAIGFGSTNVARRALVEAAVLGTAAILVASFVEPLRGAFGTPASASASGETSSPPPSLQASPAATPTQTLPPGVAVATIASTLRTGSTAFTVPFDAPVPLPAGDPAVIVRLADGSYAAFDATCTHAGCTVEWDEPDGLLVCPCHGAVFDPGAGGRVLQGPTDIPLTQLPLILDPASGQFLLRTG